MADLELVRITPEYAGKKHSTFAVPLQVATSNSETPTKSLADVILRFPLKLLLLLPMVGPAISRKWSTMVFLAQVASHTTQTLVHTYSTNLSNRSNANRKHWDRTTLGSFQQRYVSPWWYRYWGCYWLLVSWMLLRTRSKGYPVRAHK